MVREYFKLKGLVKEVGELTHIERTNIPDLYKKVLVIQMLDGQILYPELRNTKLKMLEQEQIRESSLVEIEYTFEGSEKSGKRYNNIYINSIKKL